MEQENIRIGKERFFQGIFTTNANRHLNILSQDVHPISKLSIVMVSFTIMLNRDDQIINLQTDTDDK